METVVSDKSRGKAHQDWVDRMKSKGYLSKHAKCPKCEILTEFVFPKEPRQVWTSAATCPHCDALYFKTITGTGVITLDLLDINTR